MTFAKGLYQSRMDDNLIVYALDCDADGNVLYTEAIHPGRPANYHLDSINNFLFDFAKVHGIKVVGEQCESCNI